MRPPSMQEEESLLMDDLEQLLWDINEFCERPADRQDEIPDHLENYMKFVAKTGNTVFPWQHVRPLFRCKMLKAISDFEGEICSNEAFILERFDMFRAAPFTIQRFAELVTEPKRHYSMKEKYLRGLEKTVLVVTTVDPKSLCSDDSATSSENGRESESMMWFSSSDENSLQEQHKDLMNVTDASNCQTTRPIEIDVNAYFDSSVVLNDPKTDVTVSTLPTTQALSKDSTAVGNAGSIEQCQDGISETIMPTAIDSTDPAFTVESVSSLNELKSDFGPDLVSNEAEVVTDPGITGTFLESELTTVETESVITEIGSEVQSVVSDTAIPDTSTDSTELCALQINQPSNVPAGIDGISNVDVDSTVSSSLGGNVEIASPIPAEIVSGTSEVNIAASAANAITEVENTELAQVSSDPIAVSVPVPVSQSAPVNESACDPQVPSIADPNLSNP